MLIAANLVPLAGVLLFGWDTLTILVLYWLENGVIGVFNVLRIRRAEGPEPPAAGRRRRGIALSGQSTRGYLAGFFCLHYGIFWLVHGVFVFAIPAFAGDAGAEVYRGLSLPAVGFGATLFGLSHGVSYVRNFLGRAEYRHISPSTQFGQPYPRLFALHVTILAGAWLLIRYDEPVLLVALLVVLKTAIDVALHLRRHRRLQRVGEAAGPA